jgi:hypothetical protein
MTVFPELVHVTVCLWLESHTTAGIKKGTVIAIFIRPGFRVFNFVSMMFSPMGNNNLTIFRNVTDM